MFPSEVKEYRERILGALKESDEDRDSIITDVLEDVANNAYSEGHDDGYNEGFDDGLREGKEQAE